LIRRKWYRKCSVMRRAALLLIVGARLILSMELIVQLPSRSLWLKYVGACVYGRLIGDNWEKHWEDCKHLTYVRCSKLWDAAWHAGAIVSLLELFAGMLSSFSGRHIFKRCSGLIAVASKRNAKSSPDQNTSHIPLRSVEGLLFPKLRLALG